MPRFVAATEWISSTMTHRTYRSVSRACDVSMRYSDSGVVMQMSGGRVTSRRRSAALVSPVRTPTVGKCTSMPRRSAAKLMPRSGARRFLSTSTASARSGERYSTRVRSARAGSSSLMIRSMAHRNAARVLPEPVGAAMRQCWPAAMVCHPATWHSVGAANVVANHSAVGVENALSAGCLLRRPAATSSEVDGVRIRITDNPSGSRTPRACQAAQFRHKSAAKCRIRVGGQADRQRIVARARRRQRGRGSSRPTSAPNESGRQTASRHKPSPLRATC